MLGRSSVILLAFFIRFYGKVYETAILCVITGAINWSDAILIRDFKKKTFVDLWFDFACKTTSFLTSTFLIIQGIYPIWDFAPRAALISATLSFIFKFSDDYRRTCLHNKNLENQCLCDCNADMIKFILNFCGRSVHLALATVIQMQKTGVGPQILVYLSAILNCLDTIFKRTIFMKHNEICVGILVNQNLSLCKITYEKVHSNFS